LKLDASKQLKFDFNTFRKREAMQRRLDLTIFVLLMIFTMPVIFVSAQNFDDVSFYVGHVNCDDDGDGTHDHPFCSIQVGLDELEAGDVLMILNGVYHERVYLANSGTESHPIVVRGESHDAIIDAGCPAYPCDEAIILEGEEFVNANDDDEPLFTGFFIGWQEYIILDGFTARNAPVHNIKLVETMGVTIQNMRVQNASLSLVNVYDSYNFKLLNTELRGGNLGRQTTEGVTVHITHEEAITIVNTDGFEIANNHLSDGFKEGIDVKVGSRNGTVHHNVVERLCAVGIYLNEVHNIKVFGNTVSDIGFIKNNLSDIGVRADEVQRCDEVLTGTLVFQPPWDDDPSNPDYQQDGIGYEPGNGILLAVGDLGDDLNTGRLSNIDIYQNIVRDINVGCMVLWDELRESGRSETGTLEGVRIFNNVFYNCARSRDNWGPGIILDKSIVDIKIHNNIIAFASDMSDEIVATTYDGLDISNNLFFEAGDTVGTQSLMDDPLFIDPDGGNFHLQSSSPSIDAGIDVGLPFEGTAPDLGIFESGS
jgi:hypothetical protein